MFSDREKKVFNLLEKLYTNESTINRCIREGKELNYVENFNIIWKVMLKTALKDEYDILKGNI